MDSLILYKHSAHSFIHSFIQSFSHSIKVYMEPAAKRARRECPICGKSYAKLTDHLTKAYKLDSKEQRQPYMAQALKKTPELRIISKFIIF